MTVIIAKNQTAGDLSLDTLSAPDAKIPGSGQAQLTDWNAPYEVTADAELLAYINGDQVLLNVDGVDLTKAESLTAASQRVAGTANGLATLDGSGDVPDAQIPSGIARDSEVSSAISTHAGIAAAHHTKYLDSEAVSAMGSKADGNPLNHDRPVQATESVVGISERASQTEVDTGSDDVRHVTPLKLASSFLGSEAVATGEPTGFKEPVSDITIVWSDVAKTLTVAPTGASFDVWQRGSKYTKSAPEVKDISGVIAEGPWYFFYDTAGVLQAQQAAWSFDGHAPVAIIYWDATNTKALAVWWEPHRITMDWATHKYLHTTVNTRFRSGLGTSGNTTGDGSVASHAYVEVGSGGVADEDLDIDITQGVGVARFEQDLASPAKIPVWYLNGATPVWRVKTVNSFALLEGAARIQYNQFSSPNWLQTDASSNGNFVAVWLFATNDQTQPVIAILGQREDSNLASALVNNTLDAMNLSGQALQEMKVLARLLFQTSTAYANAPSARLRHILDLRTSQQLPGGGFVATTHNSLVGRSDPNSHPASAVAVTTTNFDGGLSAADSDSQTALETVDNKLWSEFFERIATYSYTGSTTWQQVNRWTTTSLPAGDYIIEWAIVWGSDDAGKYVRFRVQVDDTQEIVNPTTGYLEGLACGTVPVSSTESGFRRVTLTAATHDIDLDLQLEDGGKTGYVYQASLVVRRI